MEGYRMETRNGLGKKGDKPVEGVGMERPLIKVTLIWGGEGTGGAKKFPIQTGLANLLTEIALQEMPRSSASTDTRGAW